MGLDGVSEQVGADFKAALGRDLISLSLHGLETPLFWPAHCLAVLRPATSLVNIHPLVAKWRRRGLEPPLLLTRAELRRSAGAFPLELLNLRLDARQLVGEDLLGPLELDPGQVRLQCGRELVAKAVVLRRAYSQSTLPEEVVNLVAASLPLYLAVFRGLEFAAGREPPLEPEAVIGAAAAGRVSAERSLFSALLEVAIAKGKRRSQEELHRLAGLYLAEAERLAVMSV